MPRMCYYGEREGCRCHPKKCNVPEEERSMIGGRCAFSVPREHWGTKNDPMFAKQIQKEIIQKNSKLDDFRPNGLDLYAINFNNVSCGVEVNKNAVIVRSAPILRKFSGKPFEDLVKWLDKIGGRFEIVSPE